MIINFAQKTSATLRSAPKSLTDRKVRPELIALEQFGQEKERRGRANEKIYHR
jgi:hypothetical protein